MPDGDSESRSPRPRSPRYPGISLPEALDKAELLYRNERRNAAPVDAVVRHWGYRPKSSSGLVAVAALKQFGLADEDGSGPNRRIRLTESALRIITDTREDTTDRDRLVREAALRPEIHSELWAEYGHSGLPSDSTLAHKLQWDKSFTESGTREFIRQFRQTVAYARLEGEAEHSESTTEYQEPDDRDIDKDKPSGSARRAEDGGSAPSKPEPSESVNQILVPIAPGQYVILKGSFPLSEAQWKQMFAVLGAMKPALVIPSESMQTVPASPPGDGADDE